MYTCPALVHVINVFPPVLSLFSRPSAHAASILCLQASTASCSPAAFHPTALEALCQLCSALMALTAAVCCQLEVAQPLLAAGIHKEAVNQLKDGVKAMANHLVKCMDLLDKGTVQHAWPAPPAHLLQGLAPAVCAMVKPLLHLALASAASIFGTNDNHCSSSSSPLLIPKELCSMVVLEHVLGELDNAVGGCTGRHAPAGGGASASCAGAAVCAATTSRGCAGTARCAAFYHAFHEASKY